MAAFNQKPNLYYTVPTFGTKATTSAWFNPSTTPGTGISTFGIKPAITSNWFSPQTTTTTTAMTPLETKKNTSFNFGIKPATSTFGLSSSTFGTTPVTTTSTFGLSSSTFGTTPVTTTSTFGLSSSTFGTTPVTTTSTMWPKSFGLSGSTTLVDKKLTTASPSQTTSTSFFKTPVLVEAPSNSCCVPFSFQYKPENIPMPVTTLYDVASNVTLTSLNLPKNKIEGLIAMVCMNQAHTISDIKLMLDNVFDTNHKFHVYNLWFVSLIKYSDEKFLLNKVDEQLIPFAVLYASLLRELMVENIQTPEQMYIWLIDFAKKYKNRKMLWLFTILKICGATKFDDILDMTDPLEIFVVALQTFIRYDNDPVGLSEYAIHDKTKGLYQIFLLSMTGASYGKIHGLTVDPIISTDLDNLVSRFK